MSEDVKTRKLKPEKEPEPVANPDTDSDGPTLADVMKEVNKAYGSKIISKASGKPDTPRLPTGIFLLDYALGGGIPESLCTMIYGWEASGKTTLAMRIAASAQHKHPGKSVCYLDFEGTFDPVWAKKHGVDNDALYLVQPDQGEQALDIADAIIRASDTSVLVIDSIPAITPMKEIESSMEDQFPGIQARLIGKFLRKLQQALLDERKKGHYPTIILINQWRMKIGVLHGDPRTLPGGVALKYVHSVGVEMLNKEKTDGKTAEGIDTVDYNEHSFRIRKNKVGGGIRTGEFMMVRNPDHPLGEGFIDDAGTVVDYARKWGLATGEGSQPKRFDGLDQSFKTWAQAAEYMYNDLGFFESLKRRLIGLNRKKHGQPEVWT